MPGRASFPREGAAENPFSKGKTARARPEALPPRTHFLYAPGALSGRISGWLHRARVTREEITSLGRAEKLGCGAAVKPFTDNMSHLPMKLLRKKIEKRNLKLRQRNLKLQGEMR